MDWVLLSLASAVAFTAYTLLQKRALDLYVGPVAFTALAVMLHLWLAAAILVLSPPDGFSRAVGVMMAAGVVHSGIQLLSAYALKRSPDVSRIVPVLDAYPLLVMAMAVLWLGEELTLLKWAAGLLVVAGVLIAAFHQMLPGKRLQIDRSVAAVLAAAFGIALYSVLAKTVVGELSVWQMYAITWVCASPGVLLAARMSGGFGSVRAGLRPGPGLALIVVAQATMVFAFWAGLTAFEQGPVSLISAIMSTRPVLVLLWAALAGVSLRQALRRREPGSEARWARARWSSAGLVTMGVGAMSI